MGLKKRFLPSSHSSHWNRAAGGLSTWLTALGAGAKAEVRRKQLIWLQRLEILARFLFPYDCMSSGTDMFSGQNPPLVIEGVTLSRSTSPGRWFMQRWFVHCRRNSRTQLHLILSNPLTQRKQVSINLLTLRWEHRILESHKAGQ